MNKCAQNVYYSIVCNPSNTVWNRVGQITFPFVHWNGTEIQMGGACAKSQGKCPAKSQV